MAAMSNATCDEEGYVTNDTIEHYVEGAQGGAGLIIVQFTSVMANSRGSKHHMGLHDDKYIPRLHDLTNEVKKYGARVALQFGHSGAPSRPMRLAGFKPGEQVVVAPSAVDMLRKQYLDQVDHVPSSRFSRPPLPQLHVFWAPFLE